MPSARRRSRPLTAKTGVRVGLGYAPHIPSSCTEVLNPARSPASAGFARQIGCSRVGWLADVYRIYLSVWTATHSAPNGPTELTMAHPSPYAR